MKKVLRCLFVSILTAAVVISAAAFGVFANGAALNKKSISIPVGKSYTLRVSNAGSNTVKWRSSDKSIAAVNSKGKVTARKQGTAYIQAKVGNTVLTCKVKVTAPANKPQTTSQAKDEQTQTGLSPAEEMLELVNAERKKAGASALILDDTLCKAADLRAEELVSVFSHSRPDGKDWRAVFDEFGVKASGYTGENIAAGTATAQATLDMWMSSSGHSENILNPRYTKIGIGYYKSSGGYTHYWVQIFTE